MCWVFLVIVQDTVRLDGWFVQVRLQLLFLSVLPELIGQILESPAPGSQERTLSYFTDVLTGIILVLLNGKDMLYHIASDDVPVTMLDLAHKIEKVCGKSGLVEVIPTPEVYKFEPQKRQSSVEKARKELGYNPKVKIDEALKRIYNLVKDNYKKKNEYD